jgi:CopG family nickel-responsive transcriptional regulator
MSQIDRFSVSLDVELLAAFDHHIAARGYENRSEAVRDLIRDLLLTNRTQNSEEEVAAMLTAVCDHRAADSASRLRAGLLESKALVGGTMHLPLDDHRDLYAISLRGAGQRVQALANQIQAMRGITHGHLSIIPRDG